MSSDTDDELQVLLEDGETVVAVGACHDVTDGVGPHLHARLLVSDRALRWRILETGWIVALPYGIVTGMSERTDAHRFTVTVAHRPIERQARVPAHRFLMFAWGDADAITAFTSTAFLFSRRETAAASAMREQLAHRAIVP